MEESYEEAFSAAGIADDSDVLTKQLKDAVLAFIGTGTSATRSIRVIAAVRASLEATASALVVMGVCGLEHIKPMAERTGFDAAMDKVLSLTKESVHEALTGFAKHIGESVN